VWQLATTFGTLFASCLAASHLLSVAPTAAIAIAAFAGFMLVRLFSIQHDCGHGSFFPTKRANDITGHVCSFFTMTPYTTWRRLHAGHHACANNLDRRTGDIYANCLLATEHLAKTRFGRVAERILRSAVFLSVVLPPIIFVVLLRFPFDVPKHWRRERRNINLLNLALVIVLLAILWLGAFEQFALIYGPALWLATIVGTSLTIVQHQFDGAAWFRDKDWDFYEVGLRGTSYLELPKALDWLTGNIGYHHIHHLSSKIPNYRLPACQSELPDWVSAPRLSLRTALTSLHFKLWDEEAHRMIRFQDVNRPIEDRGARTPDQLDQSRMEAS
jgi:omega-6 fatty acid desaturase (delta-12 desaturase)